MLNAELVALLTEKDPMSSPIVKALQNKLDKINANSHYLNKFIKDLHESDGLLNMDRKFVIPLTYAVMKTLHEAHPGQFGVEDLLPRINCSQCTQNGKNTKSNNPSTQSSELPPLSEPNEEINLDFAGPLDSSWGKEKYHLLSIDRFSKFPSAKITSSTSSNTVLEFLQDFFYLHGIPIYILADHASCFTSQDFKLFCDSNNIKCKNTCTYCKN